MAYQSKFKGAEIDALLDKVDEGKVLETYTEDGINSALVQASEVNLIARSDMTVSGNTLTFNSDSTVDIQAPSGVTINSQKVVVESDLSAYVTSETLNNQLAGKQDVLTEGAGISITDNVISCTLDDNPFVFCDSLPTSGEEGKIYCIPDPDSPETDNLWIEYYWKDDKWELIGKYQPVVDLTPYLKIADAEETYETIAHADEMYTALVKSQVDTFIASGGGSADNIVSLIQSAGLGNLYVKLVNSDEGESVVTINGSSLTIGAGETYEGYVDSFTAVSLPHNLKSVVVVGDTSVVFGGSGTENNTLESIQIYRTSAWSGSMQYFARRQYALKHLSIAGGKPTSLLVAFSECSALRTADVSGLDTSACTNMQQVFYRCSALTSVDLSNFNTSACTNMQQVFYRCSALTSVDLSNFNTSACTTMQSMFYGCSALTSLDLSNFNTSACTTMQSMFYGCSALTSLDLSNFNTSACTTMQSMFYDCSALTSLDLSNFDTSQVTTMLQMFSQCTSLESIAFGEKWDIGNVENVNYMFSTCSKLATVTGTISNVKISLSLSSSPLIRESALVFINGLSDEPSEENPTLSLSSTTKGYLTDDDIAIATDKGWTIA